jgi:hypothetical protein
VTRRGEDSGKTALGVSVTPLTPELADRVRAPRNAQGCSSRTSTLMAAPRMPAFAPAT